MDISTVINVVQFFFIFAIVALYNTYPLPTKNLYHLKFDTPIKLGNWYIGRNAILWNLIFLLLTVGIYVIDSYLGHNLSSQEIALKAAQHKQIQSEVFSGLGALVGGSIISIMLLVVIILGIKVYKAISKAPTLEADSYAVRSALFTRMYHDGRIKLPLKDSFLSCIDSDAQWKPSEKNCAQILEEEYPDTAQKFKAP